MRARGFLVRVVVLYRGTVAADHGGRRILEQMLWLRARGYHVTFVPVAMSSDLPLEAMSALVSTGITIADTLVVKPRRALRSRLGFADVPEDAESLRRAVKGANWIIQGNTLLAIVDLLAHPHGPVVSWDGDAASRWHASYALWLARRDPMSAARRAVLAMAAVGGERRTQRIVALVTVPGSRDAAAFGLRRRSAKMLVVPNVVRVDLQPAAADAGTHRFDVVFLGSAYGPNIDGLRWFLTEVWPSVLRRRPTVTLAIGGRDLRADTIYGGAPPEPGVAFVGRVDDVAKFYRSARVVVVPLFYGSGVPNKFLEAIAVDAPVVTTAHVARTVGAPVGICCPTTAEGWQDVLVGALDNPDSGRADPRVRSAILASNGPRGFDDAMAKVVTRVRSLACPGGVR